MSRGYDEFLEPGSSLGLALIKLLLKLCNVWRLGNLGAEVIWDSIGNEVLALSRSTAGELSKRQVLNS